MDIKVEIKEEPNATLTQIKSECEEFETVVVSSHFVKESASDSEICNKIEIKEEPNWSEYTSTETKQEMELPSTADIDLKDEIMENDLHTEVITGDDEAAEEASRLHTESLWRNSNSSSFFFTNIKSEDSNFVNNEPDITEPCHLFSSSKPQLLESQPLYMLDSNLKDSSPVQNYKTPQKCKVSGSSFELSKLQNHNLSHRKPHTCEICNKSFTKAFDLKQHKLIHKKRRPHTCEICRKTFIRACYLKQHELIHKERILHTCEICRKTFIKAYTLKRHKLTHERKRPHTCKICNKSFTQAVHLKQHKLTHEGKEPHAYSINNKSSTQACILKQDKLTHEGIRLLICEICNKRYTREAPLKFHKLSHE